MKLQLLKNSFYKFLFVTLGAVIFFGLYFIYISNYNFITTFLKNPISNKSHLFKGIKFNIDGNDTLVFLHIQKTGGTFIERALTKDGLKNKSCKCIKLEKRCNCRNKYNLNWLFSRYSTGWKCGLHADWTELSNCIPEFLKKEAENMGYIGLERRTYFFTILRNPIDRYLSEWKHVQRGATWWQSRHTCNGRSPTIKELPPCYTDLDWSDVPLSQFLHCHSNLANNRQTRMLADLSKLGCYNSSWPNKNLSMFLSAKNNLLEFSFFGLLEYIRLTQYLFHRTFNLVFRDILVTLETTHSNLVRLSKSEALEITSVNNLDIKIYSEAEVVFLERIIECLLRERKRIDACCIELSSVVLWHRLSQKDVAYLRKEIELFNKIILRLLYLDGSKDISDETLETRKEKWNKKLNLEMMNEFE